MPTARKISITLTPEMAALVDAKIASGEYASESEVVHDGLAALSGHDAELEHWLRTEVVATYAAMQANPGRLIDLEDASAMLEAHMAKASKTAHS
ncbi:MAG: ribbon-helix-helix domain-containing protein [Beijerinckiaceae bacterium]